MNRLGTGLLVMALFVFVLLPCGAMGSLWTGDVNLKAGFKALDEDDWDPLEDQDEIGVDVDFRMDDWPISVTLGLYGSAEKKEMSGNDVEGKTGEFRIGVRKIWTTDSNMRPFIGGGLVFMTAEIEGVNSYLTPIIIQISDDDRGTGLWISGGVFWTLQEHLNIGFELAVSAAEVTLFNEERRAGGAHAALLIGYHW